MKTSSITNRRSFGIAVIMMVLSLVNVNLSAQKSIKPNPLAELGNDIFSHIKYEIIHAISESNNALYVVDEEPLENWMVNPEKWKKNEAPKPDLTFEENEMILEDWMMKTNWEDNSLMEEELQLEDWMMDSKWEDKSVIEKGLQLEDWMMEPLTWTKTK